MLLFMPGLRKTGKFLALAIVVFVFASFNFSILKAEVAPASKAEKTSSSNVSNKFAELTKDMTFSMGGNYQLNSQNFAGTNPSLRISFALTPSAFIKEIHEVGLSIGVTHFSQESMMVGFATVTEVKTTSRATNIGGFYRFNWTIPFDKIKIPTILYFGPQAGLYSLKTETKNMDTSEDLGSSSNTDISIGAQVGVNFMFSENLALNAHLFQFDTIFAEDTQLIITQSVGIKYFF